MAPNLREMVPERDVATAPSERPVARCLGRAPLRFSPWPNWPLARVATALHTHYLSSLATSVYRLRPLPVAGGIWQLPDQFHCFGHGPEVANG